MRRVWALLLGGFLLAASPLVAAEDIRTGPLESMGESLEAVTGDAWDVLVIELGGEDFVQFTTDMGGITLDFPVFSDRQQALAPAAEAFLIDRALPGQWIDLDGGSILVGNFGPPRDAARLIPAFVSAVFGGLPVGDVRFILIRY